MRPSKVELLLIVFSITYFVLATLRISLVSGVEYDEVIMSLHLAAAPQPAWPQGLSDVASLKEIAFGNRASVSELLVGALGSDKHPALYFLQSYGWSELFGANTLSLRILSGVNTIGAAAILFLALYGRRDVPSPWVVVAVFLLLPGTLYLSTTARMYSLAVFFIAVAFLAALRLERAGVRERSWAALLGAAAGAAFSTQYLALFVSGGLLAAVTVHLLAERRVGAVAWMLLGFAVYALPGLIWFGHQSAPSHFDVGSTPADGGSYARLPVRR